MIIMLDLSVQNYTHFYKYKFFLYTCINEYAFG